MKLLALIPLAVSLGLMHVFDAISNVFRFASDKLCDFGLWLGRKTE